VIRCAIIHLLAFAGLLGLGLAALSHSTALWLSLSTCLLVAAFMLSALAARFAEGGLRCFASGYLITAGLYAAIVFTSVTPDLARALPTSRLNDRLAAWMHPDQIEQRQPASNRSLAQGEFSLRVTDIYLSSAVLAGSAPAFPLPYRFAGIAQVLWTLLIGIVGGDAALWMRRTGLSPVRTASAG